MSTGGGAPRARVTVEPRRLWSLRATLAATRWLLYAAAIAGIAATVRNAVAPAGARTAPLPAPTGQSSDDAAAEWFALRFARAYLTWSPDPTAHEQGLAPFLAAGANADAGLAPAAGTSDAVAWEAIAAAHASAGNAVDYTVALSTTGRAVRYLAVAVGTAAGGDPTLLRYPALVAAPAAAPAGSLDNGGLPALDDPALADVLERALGNYIAGSGENLAADLAPGARVEPVAPGLSLRSVARLAIAGAHGVLATVVASDAAGNAYTLGYEVSVAQVGGRWEITQIAP
jgi:hypothetical protein